MLIRKITSPMSRPHIDTNSDTQLRIEERAFSAAGAAFLSAIIVNPLDVAKVSITFMVFVSKNSSN